MMKIKLAYIIYLDWNVIASLEAGELPQLENKLFEAKNRQAVSIPFSDAHIEEACSIKSKTKIEEHLSYISKLSSDVYFFDALDSAGFKIKNPKLAHEEKDEVNVSIIDMSKSFINLVNFDLMRSVRDILNLNPDKLNNISPEKAPEEIDKIITFPEMKEKYYKDYEGEISFKGLIEKTIEIFEQTVIPPNYKIQYHTNKYNKLRNEIIMIFLLFDSFGFWSDKREAYERGTRIADANHAFNGAFANMVISADRRFCMKSKATYIYKCIKTEVLNLKMDENEIMQLLEKI